MRGAGAAHVQARPAAPRRAAIRPSSRPAALALLAAVALAGGCAGAPRFDGTGIAPVELTDVPFFPQTDYQCGPAALATILAYEGLAVDADDVAPAVYVEGLRGSLQAELLGATRRHGLVPYPIEPDPSALFAEVASGKPVLVLQNLGLDRLPIWHYAVVVGIDPEEERVLLRSGTQKRRSERLNRFLASWRRADQWGFVAVDPPELPRTAEPARFIRALTGAQALLAPPDADAAYAAAVSRWPGDALVLFAAAGRHLAGRRWQAAEAAYERVLAIDPLHAAARNNLAHALAEQGCRREALRQAEQALRTLDESSPLRAAVEDTVRTLASSAAVPDPVDCTA